MEEMRPYEPASMQYDDWTGTVAGDDVDIRKFEDLLGVDKTKWRILHIEILILGGHQSIEAYGVSRETTYSDLEEIVASGRTIILTLVKHIHFDPSLVADTNPPAPLALPVVSATEFIGYGFKRFQMKLVSRNIPKRAEFEFINYEDAEED
jgi:hypothetical protein